MNLPHRFPFRWVEGIRDGKALAVFSANSTWLRGSAPIPAAFLAELVAQAAAVLLEDPTASPTTPQQRWLAGIDRLVMHRTVAAGDLLEVAVVAGRRFGNAMRVEGAISTGGEPVADVVLLLV